VEDVVATVCGVPVSLGTVAAVEQEASAALAAAPAAAVAADLVVVTIVAHVPKGFWSANGGWEFPVPLAAGAFAIALIGNGQYSLDGLLGLTYPDSLVGLWWLVMAAGVVLVFISRALFAPKAAPKAA